MAELAWVTQRQAADLLGVHVSAVPKIVRRGDLTPRDRHPSLSRRQVLQLREARAAAAAEREHRRPSTTVGPLPPNGEHVWLPTSAAAAMLGCTVVAMRARAMRGRVPSTLHDRRRWFRLDHLELVVRADVAKRRRQVSG